MLREATGRVSFCSRNLSGGRGSYGKEMVLVNVVSSKEGLRISRVAGDLISCRSWKLCGYIQTCIALLPEKLDGPLHPKS